MAIYRIADLLVKMTPKYERLRKYAEKYLCSEEASEEDALEIDLTDSYLEKKQKESPYLTLEACEYVWSGVKFACRLIDLDGFVLHASAVSYKGDAYLFSADSGTGKSTHTGFWQEVFGKEETVIINDDKPAIRQRNGVFYASGSPFSGKSDLSENVTVPIKALCFIHRSEKNEIKRMEPNEALELVLRQTLRPGKVDRLDRLILHLGDFIEKVPVYSLGVTYSPDSAKFAYESLNKK